MEVIEGKKCEVLTTVENTPEARSLKRRKEIASQGDAASVNSGAYTIGTNFTNPEKGTNAVVFAYSDAPKVAKAINNASKDFEEVQLAYKKRAIPFKKVN